MNKEEMKQYTGTKTVKAMSMTMGEAYERKLLKEGVRPSECETDKAGYLVEYEGGYQSWSPAEPFEKAYKSRIYLQYVGGLDSVQLVKFKCCPLDRIGELSAGVVRPLPDRVLQEHDRLLRCGCPFR